MRFWEERAGKKSITLPSHAHVYSDQIKVQSLVAERNKYVFKQDFNDDSDGAHLTSFVMEFQVEEANKTSDHKVLPYCVQVY